MKLLNAEKQSYAALSTAIGEPLTWLFWDKTLIWASSPIVNFMIDVIEWCLVADSFSIIFLLYDT